MKQFFLIIFFLINLLGCDKQLTEEDATAWFLKNETEIEQLKNEITENFTKFTIVNRYRVDDHGLYENNVYEKNRSDFQREKYYYFQNKIKRLKIKNFESYIYRNNMKLEYLRLTLSSFGFVNSGEATSVDYITAEDTLNWIKNDTEKLDK